MPPPARVRGLQLYSCGCVRARTMILSPRLVYTVQYSTGPLGWPCTVGTAEDRRANNMMCRPYTVCRSHIDRTVIDRTLIVQLSCIVYIVWYAPLADSLQKTIRSLPKQRVEEMMVQSPIAIPVRAPLMGSWLSSESFWLMPRRVPATKIRLAQRETSHHHREKRAHAVHSQTRCQSQHARPWHGRLTWHATGESRATIHATGPSPTPLPSPGLIARVTA